MKQYEEKLNTILSELPAGGREVFLMNRMEDLTYNEIASLLEMSPNTVPTHIKAIYRKLQVGTRGEAVYEAIQHGLITF